MAENEMGETEARTTKGAEQKRRATAVNYVIDEVRVKRSDNGGFLVTIDKKLRDEDRMAENNVNPWPEPKRLTFGPTESAAVLEVIRTSLGMGGEAPAPEAPAAAPRPPMGAPGAPARPAGMFGASASAPRVPPPRPA